MKNYLLGNKTRLYFALVDDDKQAQPTSPPMTIHRLPDHDSLTTAITEHLAMLFDVNDTIDTSSQPQGTIGVEVSRTDGNTGEVVVKALGRRFKFELTEIL